MRELMQSIFGVYTPVSVTETVGGVESVRFLNGVAGVDWEYIGGVFLFAVCMYCLLRILGGVMK